MNKKGRNLCGLLILLIALLLVGCGKKDDPNAVRSIEQLTADLAGYEGSAIVEGSTIQELTIIKRLTNDVERTDTVYVQAKLDHPNATAEQAYVMKYTLYNEGWLLDSIEAYRDHDAVWTVSTKGAPTDEHVLNCMIDRSNEQLDAFYAEDGWWPIDEYAYYFEDGKFKTSIHPNVMESGSEWEYSCIAITERIFNYVDVTQTQLLQFQFNTDTYEWNLVGEAIIALDGTWHLGDTLKMQSDGLQINLSYYSSYSGLDGYEEYEFTSRHNNNTENARCKLYFPTSQKIPCMLEYFEWDTFVLNWRIVQLCIMPDMVWCYDKIDDFRDSYALNINNASLPQLEQTGLVGQLWTSNEEQYFAAVEQKVLESTEALPNNYRLYRFSVEAYTRSEMIEMGMLDEVKEMLSRYGKDDLNFEEVAVCQFYASDEINAHYEVSFLLVKENNTITVLDSN